MVRRTWKPVSEILAILVACIEKGSWGASVGVSDAADAQLRIL